MRKPIPPASENPAPAAVNEAAMRQKNPAAIKAAVKASNPGPVHEIRHRNVRATIWKNDTAKGPMYNVTLSRMYRDGDLWKDSQSFGYDDLMNLAKLLFDAHTHISMLRGDDFTASKTGQPEEQQPSNVRNGATS